MKKSTLPWILQLSVFLLTGLSAQEVKTFELNAPPKTVDEFLKVRDEIATTPEGGAFVFLLAMATYAEDVELGETFFTIALDQSHLNTDAKGYKGHKPSRGQEYLFKRLTTRAHLPRSYFAGATPANHYSIQPPYKAAFSRNRSSELAEDRIKVFVACSGADSSRPITLQKNDKGIWKALETSTLFVDIRKPGGPPEDDI